MRFIGNEELAQRMDRALGGTVFNGLSNIEACIQQKVYEKQQWTGLAYSDALFAVAKEQPELFLTKARLQTDLAYRNKTIYFEYANGQLVNPRVEQDGKLVPVPSPLDTAGLDPSISPDQEFAIRVASKMTKIAASGRGRPSYRNALLLVASENPNLTRRRERAALR